MLGHVEVDHASAIVDQDQEDEEHAEGGGGHSEEVDGRQRAEVVVEEGAPGLGGRVAWLLGHEARDAALADDDAELEQLAMDLRRAPGHVGLGYASDEPLDLRGNLVLRGFARERLPAPEQAETGSMPADHGVWLDDERASDQRAQICERPIQKARSAPRRRTRGVERCKVPSCRRRARFSRASSARARRDERRVASRFRRRASIGSWRMMPSDGCLTYGFPSSPTEECCHG